MVAARRERTSRPSREDVASREPNILEACTMKFGYPGISPSEIQRPRLKRQAQVFAGGDPFLNERGDGLSSPKRRKIDSFPIGPPRDVCMLRHRGLPRKVVPTEHQNKSADSSPGAAKAKRNTEGSKKSKKRLITADETTTIGRLELFGWQAEYSQTSATLAARKKLRNNIIPKKARREAASQLIFGKGIAGVGVWLGKSGTTTTTASPASDLGRQFSGDGLLDGILGTPPQQTLLTNSLAIRRRQRALRPRSPGSPPRAPVDGDVPQTPTIVTLCDDAVSNGTIEGKFYKLFILFFLLLDSEPAAHQQQQ
ncbi:sister chromatid cohesion protein [Apiospora marii]|uniref:Sister chromatid cohesion protein n=1 Tax=Apiospora marii TaxID=335849 RepID=A0ABR1R260_9PEZI